MTEEMEFQEVTIETKQGIKDRIKTRIASFKAKHPKLVSRAKTAVKVGGGIAAGVLASRAFEQVKGNFSLGEVDEVCSDENPFDDATSEEESL